MTDDDDAQFRNLARHIVNAMLDDKRFRGYVREACLHVLSEAERIKEAGIVRSIMSMCWDAGVRLSVDDAGKMQCVNGHKLSGGLRGMIRENHLSLKEYLKHLRDTEKVRNHTC